MRNSLRHPLFHDSGKAPESRDGLRIRLPAVVLTLAMLCVLARVAWVQSRLPAEYLQALAATTTEDEILPARNGQILADATVLARDEDRWALQIHYRWLEQNPEPTWLRQQLRQRLPAGTGGRQRRQPGEPALAHDRSADAGNGLV